MTTRRVTTLLTKSTVRRVAIAAAISLVLVACKKTEVTPEELDARAQAAVAAKTPPASSADTASRSARCTSPIRRTGRR